MYAPSVPTLVAGLNVHMRRDVAANSFHDCEPPCSAVIWLGSPSVSMRGAADVRPGAGKFTGGRLPVGGQRMVGASPTTTTVRCNKPVLGTISVAITP